MKTRNCMLLIVLFISMNSFCQIDIDPLNGIKIDSKPISELLLKPVITSITNRDTVRINQGDGIKICVNSIDDELYAIINETNKVYWGPGEATTKDLSQYIVPGYNGIYILCLDNQRGVKWNCNYDVKLISGGITTIYNVNQYGQNATQRPDRLQFIDKLIVQKK
jgi:hypothetical protein